MDKDTQAPIVPAKPRSLGAITNREPFPTRQHATLRIIRKKPRFILSKGIKRQGPREKKFVMPNAAAKTDELNVAIAREA